MLIANYTSNTAQCKLETVYIYTLYCTVYISQGIPRTEQYTLETIETGYYASQPLPLHIAHYTLY